VKRGGNNRSLDERAVMNGLMHMLRTGCQWRAMPKVDLSRNYAAPTALLGHKLIKGIPLVGEL